MQKRSRRSGLQSFEHKKLIASLAKLDEVPADPKQFTVGSKPKLI